MHAMNAARRMRTPTLAGVPLTRRNVLNAVGTVTALVRPANARLVARHALALRTDTRSGDAASPSFSPAARIRPLADTGLGWLCRSQDRVGSGGVGDHTLYGWTPGYPEVTGYIIPTFWDYHHLFGRDDLAQRAIRMADWELRLQKTEGGFESLYEGEGQPPVAFNTAQVIRGLTRTFVETGEARYLDAAVRAGDWIVSHQEADGSWTKANYLGMKRTYDAYAAAPLAALTAITQDDRYARAAIANCEFVLRHQHANGWFDLCDNTPTGNARPSTHTLCYTVDGLLETGAALEDELFVAAGTRAAEALMNAVDAGGRLPGRFDSQWRPVSRYVVVTGSAQLGVILMKLYRRSGLEQQLETSLRLLDFLAYVQQLSSVDAERTGALPGSFPIWGRYVPFKHPSWATKFFLDLLRLVSEWAGGATAEGAQARTAPARPSRVTRLEA